jgi:hypothetical protein
MPAIRVSRRSTGRPCLLGLGHVETAHTLQLSGSLGLGRLLARQGHQIYGKQTEIMIWRLLGSVQLVRIPAQLQIKRG